jgi:sulfatase maturation enzyme AslB (radical SAM superfamily)
MKTYKITEGVKTLRYPKYLHRQNETIVNWGKEIGAYSPVTNEICLLDSTERKILQSLYLSSAKTIDGISKSTNLPLATVRRLVTNLVRHQLIVDPNLEKEVVIEYNTTTAQLYVKLTEGCNFACPGCVTASDKIPPNQAKILDQDTLQIYLESFLRSADEKQIKSVKIKWAGGEPLLPISYKLIVASQPYLQKLIKKYPKISLEQVILTNGVFINHQSTLFAKKHHIRFSISLWGTKKIQDQERRPRNHQESYSKIIENICLLENVGTGYSLNHVITPSNAKHFANFINSMWNTNHSSFIGKQSDINHPIPLYIAFYRPQSFYQQDILTKQYCLMEQGLRSGFSEIKKMINLGIEIQPLNRIDYLNLSGMTPAACGSGYNYVAVGPKGAVSCHEELLDMKDNLDKIIKGVNIFDLVNQDQLLERSLYLGTNIKFEQYKYIGLHGGQGCPRMRKIENKGDLSISGSVTKFYLSILNELLSLECLQQIRFK